MKLTPTETVRTQAGWAMRRLVALALVLWLGGVGCLLGCETDVFAAPSVELAGAGESQDAGEGESCPSSAGHDCCRRAKISRGGKASVETPSRSIPMMVCCPLAGQTAEQVRKTRLFDEPPAVAASNSVPAPHVVKPLAALSHSQRRVPDRGGTYLLCCVFLI